MNGAKPFLDTNVFVYTFDAAAPEKRRRARELVAAALDSTGAAISSQVIQEFLNVATRKFATPLSAPDAGRYLDRVLAPLCRVFPSIGLYRRGLEVAERWRLSFYDALIVAAAEQAGCDLLLTEDLQDGLEIGGLRVADPFRGL